MVNLRDIVMMECGLSQFRLTETNDGDAMTYTYYSQADLENGLTGIASDDDRKQLTTKDPVSSLAEGDVVFSLISGTASIARKEHTGYFYSQNYIRITPGKKIDHKFLVYLLNESPEIKRQLSRSLQGTRVLKYTLGQVRDLKLKPLPSMKSQEIVGALYFNQKRLEALKKRVAALESIILIKKLEKVKK